MAPTACSEDGIENGCPESPIFLPSDRAVPSVRPNLPNLSAYGSSVSWFLCGGWSFRGSCSCILCDTLWPAPALGISVPLGNRKQKLKLLTDAAPGFDLLHIFLFLIYFFVILRWVERGCMSFHNCLRLQSAGGTGYHGACVTTAQYNAIFDSLEIQDHKDS